MRLSIVISHFSNLLFFIQKTSQFRSVRLALQKCLAHENINLFFYGKNENEICRRIEESAGEQCVKQFQKIIVSPKSIFYPYWFKESKNLLLWKKYFQNNLSLFRRVIFDIEKLSGVARFTISKIPIYLISDPAHSDKEIHSWFSWTQKKSFIVVEIPRGLKPSNDLFPVSILAHEFFHLIFREDKNLFPQINKMAKESGKLFTKLSGGMTDRIFLEELLISSFIPEGYLGEKYFHTKITTCFNMRVNNLLAWRRFAAYKLKQTAKDYVNKSQPIDEEYIRALVSAIKQRA